MCADTQPEDRHRDAPTEGTQTKAGSTIGTARSSSVRYFFYISFAIASAMACISSAGSVSFCLSKYISFSSTIGIRWICA